MYSNDWRKCSLVLGTMLGILTFLFSAYSKGTWNDRQTQI
jgi:hypothetical protein